MITPELTLNTAVYVPDPDEERRRHIAAGMAVAAGIVMSVGEQTIAEEILAAAGLTTLQDMRDAGVDRYDIRLCLPALRSFQEREGAGQ